MGVQFTIWELPPQHPLGDQVTPVPQVLHAALVQGVEVSGLVLAQMAEGNPPTASTPTP
jgi:hypothetical protein